MGKRSTQLQSNRMPSLTGNSFDPNKDIPDLSGKTFVITGGTAGIGYGITAHILQHNPSKIFLLSNKEEHAEEAQHDLQKYGDTTKVHWMKCNLQDLKQVDEVAKNLRDTLDQLDGLILNAGVGVGVYKETADGIDSHMQVNVISQFHLMLMLLPILQKTPGSRLALQSSELHRPVNSVEQDSKVRFESLQELNRDIGAMNLYNRTKFAQILVVKALERRKKAGQLGFKGGPQGKSPWTNATHPGGVKTDQQDQAVEAYGTMGKLGVMAVRPFMKDPVDEGCRPILFAATSPAIVDEDIWGQYIVPDRKVTDPSKDTNDDVLQENLWKLSMQLLSEKVGPLPYA